MLHKKLGFGGLRLPLIDPNDSRSVDIKLLTKMIDEYLARGFQYFDTALGYRGGKSERALKEVLVERHPRDSFIIADKLPAYKMDSDEYKDYIFERQLEKLGIDYFDNYLLHNINVNTIEVFEKYDCFKWIKEKKVNGTVRKIGFSFHDGPELLDEVLTKYPEFDIVQLQINYLDWKSPIIQSQACHEVATRHNKQIIVMEPVKGGTLANIPKEAEDLLKRQCPDMSIPSWAIRFAASLDNVIMVLSGMSDLEQVLDNTSYMMNFQPLSREEMTLLQKVADIMQCNTDISCTGCSYCTDDCPRNIAIPKYFELYNADLKESRGTWWTSQELYYKLLIKTFGKPSDCVKCGKCEKMCPQQLPIREYLESVSKHFEKK